MHTQNYYITTSNHVSGGGTKPIALGYPEQSEMFNDICLCKKGSGDFIPLNSLALRTALLNSADFLRQNLHIEVKPVVLVAETLLPNTPTQQPVEGGSASSIPPKKKKEA